MSEVLRPSMVEMREFGDQRWRLWALGKYCDLLVRLAERQGLTSDLAGRIERALAEATQTQLWLDQKVDTMARDGRLRPGGQPRPGDEHGEGE